MLGTSKSVSGFDPRSVPGCALWLDAADSSTITFSSGSNVSSWADKSGNGRNGTSTGSPTLSSGQIVFSGSQWFSGSITNTSANLTAFVVAKTTTSPATQHSRILSASAGGNDFDNTPSMDVMVYVDTANTLTSFRNLVTLSTVTTTPNQTFLAVTKTNATTNTFYLNGTASSTVTLSGGAVGSFGYTTYWVGSGPTGLNLTGTISEVLYYHADLTTSERQQIEGYLAHKWGLTGYYDSSIPLSIPGCQLWLDAADATTVVQSSGSISQWNDKSASALTATAVNNPTIVANVQNGLPGVSLNGSNQYFNLGNNLNMLTNQLYIFIVSKFNSTADGAIIGKSLQGGGVGRYSLLRVGGTLNPLVQGTGGGNDSGVNSDTNTSTRLLNMIWDRNTIVLYQNGSSVFSAGLSEPSSVTNSYSLLIGAYQNGSGGTPPAGGLYMNGFIHEILLYFRPTSSPLTTTQRQTIEGYLMKKWGIGSSTIPSTHPFSSIRPHLRTFQPSDIPGCALWLDAADATTITLSGTKVTQWNDKSGNGYNFTQSTSGNQPTYSVASLNNQNTITFTSASSNYLLGTASTNFIGTNSVSVYGVFKTNDMNSGASVFSKSLYGSAEGRILFGYRDPGTPGTIIGGIGGQFANVFAAISDTYTAGAWRTFGFVSDRSGWTNTTYQNGTSIGTATVSSNTTTNLTNAFPMLVGAYNNSSGGANPPQAGYYLDGAVGELLLFSTALTTSQRQQVEGYLAHKWGLTPSLPVISPLSIPGCQLWLDGVDPAGNGVQPSNGATVSTWVDKSGNAKNATATGTPTYLTGGGINFNGSSYFLNQTFSMNLSQRSVFIVFQETSRTQYAGIFILIPTLPERFDQSQTTGLSYATTDNSFQVYGNNSYGLYIGNANPLPKAIYNESMNITAGSGYLNGTNTTNVTATYTAGTCSGYGLGCRWQDGSVFGSLRLNGVIHEVIVFNTPLNTSQRQQIEGYLARKWGISISATLPSPHPFKSFPPASLYFEPATKYSALFNSSSLSVPSNSAVTLGTNNHTIEFWAYQTSRGQYDCPFAYSANATSTNTYYMAIGGYLGILISNPGGGWAVNMGATVSLPSLNRWHHYAIVRNGTTFTIYINGISRETATSSVSIGAQVGPFMIGDVSTTTNTPLFGYITNFRLVNGTAVYTSNFIPSTSPLTAIPNTQILVQGLTDRSANAFTVTNTGGVTLSTLSPFPT